MWQLYFQHNSLVTHTTNKACVELSCVRFVVCQVKTLCHEKTLPCLVAIQCWPVSFKKQKTKKTILGCVLSMITGFTLKDNIPLVQHEQINGQLDKQI